MFIGEKLKAMRRVRRWSQRELAEKTGIDQRQISRYETSTNKPTMKNRRRIAAAFGAAGDIFLCK